MQRLTGYAVALGVAALFAGAGCGSSAAKRHLAASLKYDKTATHSIGNHVIVKTTAIDVIRGGIKAQARLRGARALPFQKTLAQHFTRKGAVAGQPDKLLAKARALGKHPLDVAFDTDVAAFAFDDTTGAYVDEQYLDTTTGAFDLGVPTDSPVSVWVGTYADGDATLVAPWSYGYDTEFPPDATDVSWDYDGYFWAPPSDVPAVAGYAPLATFDSSGYYQIDYTLDDGTPGQAWFYLLPDDPTVGSYFWIWDDGTCAQVITVYLPFDASGSYYSLNGVDNPMSMSGQAESGQEGYLSGGGNWTIVDGTGLTYTASYTVTYLATAPADVCPATALDTTTNPVFQDPTACPAGCSVDPDFGICTIDGTLDATTGVGLSCDLYADGSIQTVIDCAAGCTAASDGFCYDDISNDVCY